MRVHPGGAGGVRMPQVAQDDDQRDPARQKDAPAGVPKPMKGHERLTVLIDESGADHGPHHRVGSRVGVHPASAGRCSPAPARIALRTVQALGRCPTGSISTRVPGCCPHENGKAPPVAEPSRWRDPNSNWGHHDFQSSIRTDDMWRVLDE